MLLTCGNWLTDVQSGAISRSVLFDYFDHTNEIWIVKGFLARRDLYLPMHGTYVPIQRAIQRHKSANKTAPYLHFLKWKIFAQKTSGIVQYNDV
jgi:hypothetical protein